MTTLYFAMIIRGAYGEDATPAIIAKNLETACQKAYVLKEHFPNIKWIVPHDDDIVNILHRNKKVESQDIIDAELELIRSNKVDGVIAVGDVPVGSGVAQEVNTCHLADKMVCFLDDVDEKGRQVFAEELMAWGLNE